MPTASLRLTHRTRVGNMRALRRKRHRGRGGERALRRNAKLELPGRQDYLARTRECPDPRRESCDIVLEMRNGWLTDVSDAEFSAKIPSVVDVWRSSPRREPTRTHVLAGTKKHSDTTDFPPERTSDASRRRKEAVSRPDGQGRRRDAPSSYPR
jgi:hypothetical protein